MKISMNEEKTQINIEQGTKEEILFNLAEGIMRLFLELNKDEPIFGDSIDKMRYNICQLNCLLQYLFTEYKNQVLEALGSTYDNDLLVEDLVYMTQMYKKYPEMLNEMMDSIEGHISDGQMN